MKKRKKKYYNDRLGNAAIAAVVLLLVVGIWKISSVVYMNIRWTDFKLEFASCVYDADTFGGYLKAQTDSETVKVCHENAALVYSALEMGTPVGRGAAKHPQDQVFLEFSNGADACLSMIDDKNIHIDFTDTSGKQWRFLIKCDTRFENIKKMLSVEGAAYANRAWEE